MNKLFQVLLCVGTLGSSTGSLWAQRWPVQGQYYVNPSVYNPAAVGATGHTHLHTSVKKQWGGTEGSPTLATLTFDAPLTDGFSVGAALMTISEGPFTNLSTMVTGGYRIPLSQRPTQWLSLGVSLGVSGSTLNSSKVDDPSDPAVVSYGENYWALDGGFGVRYQYENFQVGFSVPRFSGGQAFRTEGAADVSLKPWTRFIASVAYQYEPGRSSWKITPHLLYHYDVAFTNQLEFMTRATYRKKAWGGLGYRQYYGFSLLGGAQVTDKFAATYVFTLPGQHASLTASHELALRLRLNQQ